MKYDIYYVNRDGFKYWWHGSVATLAEAEEVAAMIRAGGGRVTIYDRTTGQKHYYPPERKTS